MKKTADGIVTFTDEDVRRFHAGWLGVDYDSWKDSPGGRDDFSRDCTGVNKHIRDGLKALFPGCRFEQS